MKILIVEDEEILAKVLEEKFEKANMTSKIAFDGESALEMVKSFKPEVVVLDLMLPKKDGFEVLKELKEKDETKRIPVVVISNLAEDESIKRALGLGAKDYFVKSNHPVNEIVEKVKNISIKAK